MLYHCIHCYRYVQQTTNSPVDMRVGIHTGAILAGVLGQRQWQFDVYSKDVELANKMESSGMAGRVHISATTLSFLSGEFEVEPAYGEKRDESLRMAGLKTYFIVRVLKPKTDEFAVLRNWKCDPYGYLTDLPRGGHADAVAHCAFNILVLGAALDCEESRKHWARNGRKVQTLEQEISDGEQKELISWGPHFVGRDGSKCSKHVASSSRTRSENLITRLQGPKAAVKNLKGGYEIWKYFFDDDMLEKIVKYTNKHIDKNKEKNTVVKEMQKKLINSDLFSWSTEVQSSKCGRVVEQQWDCYTKGKYTLSALLLTATIALALLARHMEQVARVLFLWRSEVEEQRECASDMRRRNEALVYNILPPHVAEHFMGNRKRQHDELYSQSYAEVGVLFASMPNFSDFYSEESVNNQGLECLRFLNEVISDFDAVSIKIIASLNADYYIFEIVLDVSAVRVAAISGYY
ncbi:adenylate cyclase type 1 [Holotrichia oblita]|uniref:Adenylate cyclase type 1 n=1 Tax=Holotrichia oblita TaxID=644536 RepID=A0ACB9TGS3_HOLOL|nr:adenylate cyclase type 1 [Holotrichia oblita]